MLPHEQTIFFALLRAALWPDPQGNPTATRLQEVQAAITQHPTPNTWTTLLKAFEDHAMLGVVAHTIMSLPEPLLPTAEQQRYIHDHVANLLRTHHQLQTAIITLFTQMQSAGLHPILLKGEGYATLYPHTCIRSCGDIDIYVPPTEFTPARQIIDTFMGEGAQSHDDSLHYEIAYNGIEIELHHTFTNSKIAGVNMEPYNQYMASIPYSSCPRVRILGHDIPVLPSLQDYLFSLVHLYKHASIGWPSLRLFLDTLSLLRHYPDDIPESRVADMLRQFHILQPLQQHLGILHYQFGMSKSHIPCWDEKLAKKSQGNMLQEYLKVGNFAQHDPEEDAITSMPPGLRRKAKHFLYILTNANKTKRTFNPTYTRWHSLKDLLHLTYTQIKQYILNR